MQAKVTAPPCIVLNYLGKAANLTANEKAGVILVTTNFVHIANNWQYDMIIPVWVTNHKIWPSAVNKENNRVEQIVTEEEISVLKRRKMDNLKRPSSGGA